VRRTLEAIFRHPVQSFLLIAVLPVVGVAMMYVMVPRTYQSRASLWVYHRYEIIGATGAESDLNSTPAQTQATALGELLQTRSFVLSVVKGIDLAPTLGLSADVMNDPERLQNALFDEISKHVLTIPSAYNLFTITYSNRNPKIAQEIVASVIANYGKQSLGLSLANGQNILATYQAELATAQNNLNSANTAESQYQARNPNLTPAQLANDQNYKLLDSQKVQAQANVQSIQNSISQLQQSIGKIGTNPSSLFQTIDAPQVPDLPNSRTKDYLIGGGIGLVVGLLAWVVFLLVLVRRDHGIYSARDLHEKITFPVVMQLPKLTTATLSLLTPGTAQDLAQLSGGKSDAH
jgi:uncharacterized protein involved in exopolysaccharide biosynthesis